jgi:hypothetical protein
MYVMTEEVAIYCCRYCGLFIEQGPLFKLNLQGKKSFYDRDKKIEWDGPLVIMVNSFRLRLQRYYQQRFKIKRGLS